MNSEFQRHSRPRGRDSTAAARKLPRTGSEHDPPLPNPYMQAAQMFVHRTLNHHDEL